MNRTLITLEITHDKPLPADFAQKAAGRAYTMLPDPAKDEVEFREVSFYYDKAGRLAFGDVVCNLSQVLGEGNLTFPELPAN